MDFAHKLAMLRKKKGLSQIDLANKIGVSHGTIGNYESGKRTNISKPILNALAVALDVSITELLDTEKDIMFSERAFGKKPDIALYNEDGTINDIITPEEYEKVPQSENSIAVPNVHIQQVIQEMSQLNEEGQKEAARQIKLLTEIPKFKRNH